MEVSECCRTDALSLLGADQILNSEEARRRAAEDRIAELEEIHIRHRQQRHSGGERMQPDSSLMATPYDWSLGLCCSCTVKPSSFIT